MITIPNHKITAWQAKRGDQIVLENGPDDTLILWPDTHTTPAFISVISKKAPR